MPGDRWQQLANLRALYAYMWAHPGKKLLFMGGELATPWEWSGAGEGRGGSRAPGARRRPAVVRDLNRVYREEPALWEMDFSHEGFQWVEPNDAANNVLAFARLSRRRVEPARLRREPRACAAHALPRRAAGGRRVDGGVEHGLRRLRRLGRRQRGASWPTTIPWHDQPYSAELTLPAARGRLAPRRPRLTRSEDRQRRADLHQRRELQDRRVPEPDAAVRDPARKELGQARAVHADEPAAAVVTTTACNLLVHGDSRTATRRRTPLRADRCCRRGWGRALAGDWRAWRQGTSRAYPSSFRAGSRSAASGPGTRRS